MWQPGFRLPLHKHEGGHELTYVIEGEQTFEIGGVGTKIVKAGEIVYTPPDTAHFRKLSRRVPMRTSESKELQQLKIPVRLRI